MFGLQYATSMGMLHCALTVGYVGPGAGLTMLGALLAVVFVLLFALLAPFLYVLRWVRSWLNGRRPAQTTRLEARGPLVREEAKIGRP